MYSLSFVLSIYTSDFRLSASIRYLCELSPSCIIVDPGCHFPIRSANVQFELQTKVRKIKRVFQLEPKMSIYY